MVNKKMERSKDWIDEAEGDLEHAINDVKSGFYNWACFSAQQSAEKAVKAVFQKMGAEAWGHSVSDLLKELSRTQEIPPNSPLQKGGTLGSLLKEGVCQVPDELLDEALELDKAYIAARYPDAHPAGSPRSRYTKREAERLIEYAERIFRFCSDLLSSL